MQKLFGFKKIGALSVAILTSFVAIDAYARGIPGITTNEDCRNQYTTLVPQANQVTWSENQYCMVSGCLDGYTPSSDGSSCVAVSQSSGAACGVNLFNPQLLTEADFTASTNNGVTSYTGTWEHLNKYVTDYPFSFMPGKQYSVSYEIECPEELVGNTYITFKLANGGVVQTSNACSGSSGTVASVKIDLPAGQTATGLTVAQVSGNEVSAKPFKIQNVMVALSNQSGFVAYNPCIKLTTPRATETRMRAVENRLGNVRTTIDSLITQMQTNSSNIGGLQSDKQTRPDDNKSCPADKKCLLVKDRNNQDNWYEITDCDEHAFFSDMGTSVGSGSNAPLINGNDPDAGKYCMNTYNGATYGYQNCSDGEWGHLYEKGMVYGQARAVAIAEAPGTVVTLPNNVATGDTCVCRVTGFAPLVSGTIADSNAVYASSKTSFTTDEWVVGGKISTHTTSSNLPMTDASCVDVCAFDDVNGLVKASYYASISNTCSAAASEAQMCRYYPFFATAADNVAQVHNNGFVVNNVGSTGCAEDQHFASNPHCSTNGSWIIEYVPSGEHASGETVGYAYGTVGFATVPAGTTQYSMVDLSASDLSMTYTNQNAIVCMVQGYEAASDTSETNVTLNKGFVVDVGNAYDTTDVSGYSRYCVDAVSFGSNYSGVTAGQQWFDALSNICVAY